MIFLFNRLFLTYQASSAPKRRELFLLFWLESIQFIHSSSSSSPPSPSPSTPSPSTGTTGTSGSSRGVGSGYISYSSGSSLTHGGWTGK